MKMAWLWIFPGVGVLMLAGAIMLQVDRVAEQAGMTRTTGTVVDISHGCPSVEFSASNGETLGFDSSLCSRPPAYARGESLTVLYDPQYPDRAQIDSFTENWFASLVLGGIGAVFLLIGSALVVPPLLAKRRARELSSSGQSVLAELLEVRRNTALSINGNSPWQIVAQWQNPATGKVHLFSSDNLWFDPSPYMNDQQVGVFIDPQNPKRYSMDTSFLPELAD